MLDLAKHDFTAEDVQLLLDNLDTFDVEELEEVDKIIAGLEHNQKTRAAHDDLIAFCKYMQPDYIVGRHHRILADLLMRIEMPGASDLHGKNRVRDLMDRIAVNIPPRHGKSQLVSIYFPAWFLGRNPNKKVLMVSHTTDLAVDFGRKVRNLIATKEYREIFPNVSLAHDSKSAGRWTTNHGGEFYACGVGSSLAGRGADLLIIDDPHSEQDILAGNYEIFEKAYEWFTFGARTRLMPGGRIAIVQCMVGDTKVRMANGVELPLRDIRQGDLVATYENKMLTTSEVLNWQSNGIDKVFAIKTISHRIIRANERHPFLVNTGGVEEWIRVKDLKPGMKLVALRGAQDQQEHVPVRGMGFVQRVSLKGRGIKNTQALCIYLLDTMANTGVKFVRLLGVKSPCIVKACVEFTMGQSGGARVLVGGVPRLTGLHTLNIGMGLRWKNITRCWRDRGVSVQFVRSPLPSATPAHTGLVNYVLTTVTKLIKSGGFSAMTVTLQRGMQRMRRQLWPSQNILELTQDEIVEIIPDGEEEVFDVQIERTENFIADGVISHNTRWHLDDLTGRVVKDMALNSDADQYEVVEFPALLDIEDPVLGIVQKPLWPEFFNLEALLRTKASMPLFQWNAQFQQNPTAEEGAIVRREWWREWKLEKPPKCEYVIMTLDCAQEKHNRADFTGLTTWGVFNNEEEKMYNIILLNSVKERMEYPELKLMAKKQYDDVEPDAFIVEKKSSGASLYQELRRTGIIVSEYTPHRGSGDKTARLNSVADMVKQGICWVPQTRFAEELTDEVAEYPHGSNDDLVDCTIMALMRFRQGGFVRLPTDLKDEPRSFRPKKAFY